MGSFRRENLPKIIEDISRLVKKFGSESRFSTALDSVINELKSKFSFEFENSLCEIDLLSDFRTQSIICEKHLKSVSTDLMKNVVTGSYGGVDRYLKTHFYLLLEDFLTPLRDGMNKISGKSEKSDCDLYDYGNVELIELKTTYDKISAVFRLDDVTSLSFDVESSQRLMTSSLVVLVFEVENEKLFFFATVSDKLSQRGTVEISFLKSEDYLKVVALLPGKGNNFRLFESPVYFEAYSHVLSSLQQTINIPFADNLIEGKGEVMAPTFHTEKIDLNISALYEKRATAKSDRRCYSSEEVNKTKTEKQIKRDYR